ncbi:MAG: RagB/SusD family nutrient uptake outer membrane protein [Prevotella sp.]|nr:RagB/SusD family nutrient uptake outer membrane protein [Prevotella sp.]
MKRLNKIVFGLGILLMGLSSLSSCIEETEPTSYATTDQVAQSSSATEALLMAQPAYFNHLWDEDRHYSFGYGAMMHIRDLMCGDLTKNTTSYNQWRYWICNQYQGDQYVFGQFVWNYYYGFVLTANNMISGVNPETATDEQLGFLGTGYAFRAMLYLDLARLYEFLPNEKTSNININGNDVTNLTVPIVKAEMPLDSTRNNPRATRETMKNFIEEDLNTAEEYIVNLTTTNGHTLPDLACVYGLKARLYMWVEDYAKAQEYARKAIDATATTPMSEEQCLNVNTGFNVTDPWMWGAQMTTEDEVVQTGIINWTSHLSNESTFGYCGASTGLYNICDRRFYERISDTDFRKKEFKAPAGSALDGQTRFLNPATAVDIPDYGMVKFRCGQGNADDYMTGGATAYPIMRVEEMYFIEAEAAAHQNATQGKQLVEDFMKKYRDPQYTCSATSTDDVVEEIVFQKRVELIGEGHTFFDIKRLNYSVTRGYPGTNWAISTALFNTNGRPAWMNFVMVRTEKNNNKAVDGWNNPDPSDVYKPWTGQ